ncbi:hypothetical protein L7F22_057627 [Adiantum nelumboides]|nr:hypothetical protein [Adiantum nelumboides]
MAQPVAGGKIKYSRFRGRSTKDPDAHLRQFSKVYGLNHPAGGVPLHKQSVFESTLSGKAAKWLSEYPDDHFQTYDEGSRVFLRRFKTAEKTVPQHLEKLRTLKQKLLPMEDNAAKFWMLLQRVPCLYHTKSLHCIKRWNAACWTDSMQHMGGSYGCGGYLVADTLYDLGTALEVVSPLCPHLFLEVAGIANLAKGTATVAARATRLPIYSGFAKEGNLSDLYAKGEAISTLFNVLGLGVGIRLASTVCSRISGKLVALPLISAVHLFSISQQIRAAPLNTLNSQRTACIIAEFVKTGNVPTPAEIRYKERLALPVTLNVEAGSVVVGASIRRAFGKPSLLKITKAKFREERILLSFHDRHHDRQTHMVLHRNATGEDVVRGRLLSAYIAGGKLNPVVQDFGARKREAMEEAYELLDKSFPILVLGLREAGWHTDLFLEGGGERALW